MIDPGARWHNSLNIAVPTQTDLLVQLTEAEGTGGRIVGTAETIAEGLKLEELQYVLYAAVRGHANAPTDLPSEETSSSKAKRSPSLSN